MKKPDDLFLLIHSLDRSEKGYFKKFSSIYGKKEERTYFRLFEFIGKQKEYNDEKMQHHFRKEKFIRQPAVAKHYLFNLLLKSLESYHSSVEAELESMLHRMEILFEKGLYDLCERILIRAKKLAKKYERHTFSLELMKWEIELTRARSYVGKTETGIKDLFKNIFSTLETYKNINEYSFLVSQLFVKEVKGGFARAKKELNVYEPIMQDPLLKNEKRAESYQAKYYFYLSHIGYHSIRNEFGNALSYSKKLVALLEAHPHQFLEKPRTYVSVLRNHISCLGKLKRYTEIPAFIKKMRTIQTRSEAIRNTIFYSANILDLETYVNTGQFEKGVKLVTEFEEQRTRLNKKALNKLNETILNYNVSCTYFGAKNYSAANKYLNRILNDTHIDLRSDIQCFSRILSLLIHYEMGNADLLSYLIRSTYRYLYKRKHLYKFETIVLQFIRNKIPKLDSKKELMHAFEELKKEIVKISKDPFERTALEYFDFISWLESKISGRSFAEIVREKAG